MKSMFRGYYPPSDEEFERLWTEGTIVLDANALLHFFRYSAATRDELMDLLRKEKARLWLPHQVGAEFHRNRRAIPGQQRQAFTAVETALEKARNSVQGAIDELGRHANQEAKELTEVLKKHDSKLRKKLKRVRKRHADAVTSSEAQNKTFQAITELYEGRVGKAYSQDELATLFKEGATRYSKEVPPGFADAKLKEGDRKYGDLIVWRQILDYAANEKKPLLFITDDGKEDWWEKVDRQNVGPRPELVEEFYEASGEPVHFYSVRRFLAFAKQRGEEISDSSVEEARTISKVSDAQARVARRRHLQQLIERFGDVHMNSPEFKQKSERGRELVEQLLSGNPSQTNRPFSEWLAANPTSQFGVNDPSSQPATERLLSLLAEESPYSEASREMLRDERAANQLRILGLFNESNDQNGEGDQRGENRDSDQED